MGIYLTVIAMLHYLVNIILINMTIDEYLLVRFIRSNHPKYRKYAVEWVNNLTIEQLSYFKKEMIKSIII